MAVAAFFFAEWAERRAAGTGQYLGSRFLRAFSVALVFFAVAMLILPSGGATSAQTASEASLLAAVDAGADHIEPEELADQLVRGDADLVVVDVRPAAEFEEFHIRGAINVPLAELAAALAPHKAEGRIVLYSNGMTHPAQARDHWPAWGSRTSIC